MSGIVSKKLKFKGDKPKKKKRTREAAEDDGDELAAMAAGDPRGWVFPESADEIAGPSFIILPTEPPTCLAWHPGSQKVFAAPLDLPETPEGHAELSRAEILSTVEPTDVNHVWVASRLSGSEDVISLRSSSGTFLTAHPSGALSASTSSRGPLEAFTPLLVPPSSSPSSSAAASSSLPFPSINLQTQSTSYLSANSDDKGAKPEIRADAEHAGYSETWRIKCQREQVLKIRMAKADEKGGMGSGKSRAGEGYSREDEMRINKEAQTWGGGKVIVSDKGQKDIKRAKKEGRLAEAMLDRRAAMKSDRYAK